MLILAIIFITLALVFYSIGVWSEKIQKTLKLWHVVVFYLGLICDTTGTTLMSIISESKSFFNIHGITGLIAILLMLFHAVWATHVYRENNEQMKKKFHKFSLLVWFIWLIPYLSGAVMQMS